MALCCACLKWQQRFQNKGGTAFSAWWRNTLTGMWWQLAECAGVVMTYSRVCCLLLCHYWELKPKHDSKKYQRGNFHTLSVSVKLASWSKLESDNNMNAVWHIPKVVQLKLVHKLLTEFQVYENSWRDFYSIHLCIHCLPLLSTLHQVPSRRPSSSP